jgi:hypothetical protein
MTQSFKMISAKSPKKVFTKCEIFILKKGMKKQRTYEKLLKVKSKEDGFVP